MSESRVGIGSFRLPPELRIEVFKLAFGTAGHIKVLAAIDYSGGQRRRPIVEAASVKTGLLHINTTLRAEALNALQHVGISLIYDDYRISKVSPAMLRHRLTLIPLALRESVLECRVSIKRIQDCFHGLLLFPRLRSLNISNIKILKSPSSIRMHTTHNFKHYRYRGLPAGEFDTSLLMAHKVDMFNQFGTSDPFDYLADDVAPDYNPYNHRGRKYKIVHVLTVRERGCSMWDRALYRLPDVSPFYTLTYDYDSLKILSRQFRVQKESEWLTLDPSGGVNEEVQKLLDIQIQNFVCPAELRRSYN